jgi:hypothetical protein
MIISDFPCAISLRIMQVLSKKHLAPYFKELSNFILPDLADLALDYLTIKDVPIHKWDLVRGEDRYCSQLIAISPIKQEIYVLVVRKDRRSYVWVYSLNGDFLRHWTTDIECRDIALSSSEDMLFAVSCSQITIFSPEGKKMQIKEIVKVEEDWNPCQINSLAVDPEAKIYVCDADNHRIRVFSLIVNEIKEIYSWVLPGLHPSCLTLFENEIYVPELRDVCIQVFTPSGVLKRTFKTFVSTHGGYRYPLQVFKMVISPEREIYVPNVINHEINIFNLNGVFLRCIGDHRKGDLFPNDIAISLSGELFVFNAQHYLVQVFRRDYD